MYAVRGVVYDEVVIEPASWRDLGDLRRLEKLCFPDDAWPLLDLLASLSFPNVLRFRAVRAGKAVGFVIVDLRRGEQTAWIATVCVDPQYQNQGIGGRLLRRCEGAVDTPVMRLCVRKSNEGAIRLYQRHGYVGVEEWPSYYQDGEAALVMEKRLIRKESIGIEGRPSSINSDNT